MLVYIIVVLFGFLVMLIGISYEKVFEGVVFYFLVYLLFKGVFFMVVGIIDYEVGIWDVIKFGGLCLVMLIMFVVVCFVGLFMFGLLLFIGFIVKEVFYYGIWGWFEMGLLVIIVVVFGNFLMLVIVVVVVIKLFFGLKVEILKYVYEGLIFLFVGFVVLLVVGLILVVILYIIGVLFVGLMFLFFLGSFIMIDLYLWLIKINVLFILLLIMIGIGVFLFM